MDGRTDARTDAHTHAQRENSIPTTNKVWGGGGYKNICNFQQVIYSLSSIS